jgi:hypothetical protein
MLMEHYQQFRLVIEILFIMKVFDIEQLVFEIGHFVGLQFSDVS